MILVALNEAAERGELLLVDGGLCRFHLRRDGVVVIRELLVLPTHRRKGVGRALVGAVRARHPSATLRATCPAEYEANEFYSALGFYIAAYKLPDGKLIVWEQDPTSSTARTAIPSSPPPQ
jgi:GNAT superfamily N-acetyltransferase